MKTEITFLGTSQAVPTKTRNHSAIYLNYKNENILIDCGEGTQRQIRIAKINPCKITKILLTHWHGDHILGLPGLLQTLALNNYQKTLEIYGPVGTKKYMSEIMRIFVSEKDIKIKIQEIDGKFFENKDFELIAYPLEHQTPCNGYIFHEKDKLRIDKTKLKKLKLPNTKEIGNLILGKNIKINNKTYNSKDLTYLEKGKKISFILDTRLCQNIKKLAKDSDLSIIESTYSDEEKDLAKDYYHLTSSQAATIAKNENVKELILTHISQRYEFKDDILLKSAKKIFKKTIIAHDFLKVLV